MKTITWLSPHDAPEWFPPPEQALEEPAGLLAAGGDLSPQRLVAAYRRGIFPWYSPGQPVLWWSPDPRAVLFPEEFRRSRSLAKSLRNAGFMLSVNQDFAGVIDGCAAPRAQARAPGSPARCAPPTWRCTGSATPTASRCTTRGAWSAGSTGCAWAGCSSASRCSAASATPRRPPWRTWSRCAGSNNLAVIDCQLPSRHLAEPGRAQHPAGPVSGPAARARGRRPRARCLRPEVPPPVPPCPQGAP